MVLTWAPYHSHVQSVAAIKGLASTPDASQLTRLCCSQVKRVWVDGAHHLHAAWQIFSVFLSAVKKHCSSVLADTESA